MSGESDDRSDQSAGGGSSHVEGRRDSQARSHSGAFRGDGKGSGGGRRRRHRRCRLDPDGIFTPADDHTIWWNSKKIAAVEVDPDHVGPARDRPRVYVGGEDPARVGGLFSASTSVSVRAPTVAAPAP